MAESIAAIPGRYETRVTLHAPADEVADRLRHLPDGALEAVDERTCVLSTKSDSVEWLAASIALIGVDFEVHEPPELVDHIRLLTARLSAATS